MIELMDWVGSFHEQDITIYSVVDPAHTADPLNAYFQAGAKARCLFDKTDSEVAAIAPWLLECDEPFLKWWQEEDNNKSGILLASAQALSDLRFHLASLCHALADEEPVVFPFYIPECIAPMLARMNPEEHTLLLQSSSLLVAVDEGYLMYQGQLSHDTEHPRQNPPWWIIQPSHCLAYANRQLVADNISAWLWDNIGSTMKKHENNNHDVTEQISQQIIDAEQLSTITIMTIVAHEIFPETTPTQKEDISGAITHVADKELGIALPMFFASIQGELL